MSLAYTIMYMEIFTCTWLDIHGKSDTHGKRVCHWHVPSCIWRFIPVPGLISVGKVISMEKGVPLAYTFMYMEIYTCTWLDTYGKSDTHGKRCVIGMYLHVHVCYIQTLFVHGNFYFKASISYGQLKNKMEL